MLRLLGLFVLLLLARPLGAQTLRDQVSELFRFGNCGEPLCLEVGGRHESHFIPELVQGQNNLIVFLTDAIGASVANIPISGASGGATFSFEGGLPVRTSVSAGPIFGERAQTLGGRRVLVGANVLVLRFRSIRGTPLDDLVFNFTHQNVASPTLGDPEFENDIVQVRTALEVDLLVTSLSATLGLTDWLDIGVAVPLVSTSLRGTSEAQIYPFSSERPHFFGTAEYPSLTASTQAEGSATGVGDIALRAKAHLLRRSTGGISLLTEVRLPTGDEAELLGSGQTSVRAMGVASARYGEFSPHLNAGFLYRSGERSRNAALLTLGFDQLLAPWATLAADLIMQWQLGDNPLQLPGRMMIEAPYQRPVYPSNIREHGDDLVYGSFGAKLDTGRGFTVVTNSLIPLTHGGLQPHLAWTLGLEYDF